MPAKKTENKLLKLTKDPEAKVTTKKTPAQLRAELMRDTKFAEFNDVMIGSEVRMPEVIPSGILRLDYEIGIGGFPRGRVVQLYGAESSWKSTICLRTCAEAQKMGEMVAWVDAERSFDPSWAKKNGVDLDNLVLIKPDTMENAFFAIEKATKAGCAVVVLDSLAALAPHKELYNNENKTEFAPIDKEGMALAARGWSKWARQGPKYLDQNNTLFMIINQLRSSLSPYGNPTSVPGGKAVKHMNVLSLNMKRVTAKDGQIIDKSSGKITGSTYEFVIDKTRMGIIGNQGSFKVIGLEVDNLTTLRDLGIREGIIKRLNVSNYEIDGEKINGQDNVTEYLKEHPETAEKIEKELRHRMTVQFMENGGTIGKVEDIDLDALESEDEEE